LWPIFANHIKPSNETLRIIARAVTIAAAHIKSYGEFDYKKFSTLTSARLPLPLLVKPHPGFGFSFAAARKGVSFLRRDGGKYLARTGIVV
jgi:hypothetical protein